MTNPFIEFSFSDHELARELEREPAPSPAPETRSAPVALSTAATASPSAAPAPRPIPGQLAAPALYFLATSNLAFGGLPVGWVQGRDGIICREPEAHEFRNLSDALAWLRQLRCGGSVSDGNRVVREVMPGE